MGKTITGKELGENLLESVRQMNAGKGTVVHLPVAEAGDVILSRRPDSWESVFALDATTEVPADFMSEADRNQSENGRDPFEDVPA